MVFSFKFHSDKFWRMTGRHVKFGMELNHKNIYKYVCETFHSYVTDYRHGGVRNFIVICDKFQVMWFLLVKIMHRNYLLICMPVC
jgi:hypothetical protein